MRPRHNRVRLAKAEVGKGGLDRSEELARTVHGWPGLSRVRVRGAAKVRGESGLRLYETGV
jgi:hypothetical protein